MPATRYQTFICPHCHETNVVATCDVCSRAFVVSQNRVLHDERLFSDAPIKTPPQFDVQPCDFCRAKQLQLGPAVSVPAGLRQRTCPSCATEFLSSYGL